MRLAHLTSAHPRYDTRIFLKMCRSLATNGHDVTLIVADGKGEEQKEGVRILDVGKPGGRLDRMTRATSRVLKAALELDADLYHLHDPELLPVGLKLKRRGKRVIFDAHEDVPKQILSKAYLHPFVRKPISMAIAGFERFACSRLNHVVAATPVIRDKFLALDIRSTDINNFPMLGELDGAVRWEQKAREVCYVGGVFATRGIVEMVSSMEISRTGARLELGGLFIEKDTHEKVKAMPGWVQVDELGFLDRSRVRDVLSRSMAGLVTLHPTPAYLDSLPVKMFEYMSAGLPLIASDFPLWREIVEGNNCGICVDPLDPAAIAEAIDRLVENPDLARRMGENGQRAVHERYNWAIEEKKLLALYDTVLLPKA
ncbi:glycosyltransferase involved in cell wall biosynthesis [Aquamicrobium lusatiense]|uniref:Glycosyltransferase involved in cell wall biosynthesis n=1 Tax=Aquamicrobium lusatiense TaxID=89772 RepID=A0A7W9S3G5_9HYPH|nr:glycosyltransferase family 4 protein [Aquamicrobium lusatiense]MBB6012238.1 glycosyltransferase involved in cell wall biosynthesis [Aquamicrobium lusatiense]